MRSYAKKGDIMISRMDFIEVLKKSIKSKLYEEEFE